MRVILDANVFTSFLLKPGPDRVPLVDADH